VTRIDHTAEEVPAVTEGGESLGSHAIVTVPLGVLKGGAVAFLRSLPASKRATIDAIQVGSFEKVAVSIDSSIATAVSDWINDAFSLGNYASLPRDLGYARTIQAMEARAAPDGPVFSLRSAPPSLSPYWGD